MYANIFPAYIVSDEVWCAPLYMQMQLRSLQTSAQFYHSQAHKVELPLLTRDHPQRYRHWPWLQHRKVYMLLAALLHMSASHFLIHMGNMMRIIFKIWHSLRQAYPDLSHIQTL